jgi:hypothetical protein
VLVLVVPSYCSSPCNLGAAAASGSDVLPLVSVCCADLFVLRFLSRRSAAKFLSVGEDCCSWLFGIVFESPD